MNRGKAAWALGALRHKSRKAVPALTGALDDPDLAVRLLAAQSLGWLGPVAKDGVARKQEQTAS